MMIAKDAVKLLESGEDDVKLTNDDKVKLMTNLLTVTCSDVDATPTVSV